MEYDLRFKSLERGLERNWKGYLKTEQDGTGLTEYAEDFLQQRLKEKYQKPMER